MNMAKILKYDNGFATFTVFDIMIGIIIVSSFSLSEDSFFVLYFLEQLCLA